MTNPANAVITRVQTLAEGSIRIVVDFEELSPEVAAEILNDRLKPGKLLFRADN